MTTAVQTCLKQSSNGVLIQVRAQPRSSKNSLVGVLDGALKIKVTAPPVDSAANEALREFLADCLDCRPGAVSLAQGGTSRKKVFLVQGIGLQEVTNKLNAILKPDSI